MGRFGIGEAMKQCCTCQKEKPNSEFSKNTKSKDKLQSSCIECNRILSREYYNKNKEVYKQKYQKEKNLIKEYRKDNVDRYKEWAKSHRLTIRGRSKDLFNAAKARSKKFNLDFDLIIERIEFALIIGKCERTGLSFDLSIHDKYNSNPFAPSIDRKDAFKGYTNDNIQIVCNAYNIGKSQMTDIEFVAFCEKVVEFNR